MVSQRRKGPHGNRVDLFLESPATLFPSENKAPVGVKPKYLRRKDKMQNRRQEENFKKRYKEDTRRALVERKN